MFSIISSNKELLSQLKEKEVKVKKAIKLPKMDEFYINFLQDFEEVEIIPDISILGYEKSLNENNYIFKNYPNISHSFWLIGESGQGDSWFLDKSSNEILFYDHNNGEFDKYSKFKNLKINFYDFLRVAFLYRDLEHIIEFKEASELEIKYFKNELDKVSPILFNLYPYKYF